MNSKVVKKVIAICLMFTMLFSATAFAFADSAKDNIKTSDNNVKKDLIVFGSKVDSLKIYDNISYEIDSLQELKSVMAAKDVTCLSKEDKRKLINETNPVVLSEFVNEKLQILEKKANSLEIVGEESKTIDLGDNCEATIYIIDEAEDAIENKNDNENNSKDSTPGAQTYWKPYGKRKFTSKFEVRTGILDVDLILVSHYTLSSKGVALRYGESEVVKKKYDIDLGSASAGSVNNVKTTAYKKGEKIHISSTFSYRWAPAYDVTIISKQFKMHNYVKYSDIDKKEKEVKVVHSWNGSYL